MLRITVNCIGIVIFLLFGAGAIAQPVKKDTVYFLIDTAKVPVNDRMFIVGSEGDFYGYKLQCHCYPKQADPAFIYRKTAKPQVISIEQLSKLKVVSLVDLIDIVSQYGADRKRKNIFYFIEPADKYYNMQKVVLLDPVKQERVY